MRRFLQPHPNSTDLPAVQIEVNVTRPRAGLLALSYTLTGNLDDISLPAVATARRDELWRHTCFEAFVRASGNEYYEFNFSPSTQWAAYRFSGYRSGMRPATEIGEPLIEVSSNPDRFTLRRRSSWGVWRGCKLRHHGASVCQPSSKTELAENHTGHWRIRLGKPDFHHADCFTQELPRQLMKFGIDRLIAESCFARTARCGRRVALLAHPASVTEDLTHTLDALAATGDVTDQRRLRPAAWPARRQAGQHDRVAGLQRPGARNPGLQPLWRGAQADRRDDGRIRRAARRSAGSRLPHLYVHHHASLHAGSRGSTSQEPSGCSIGPIPSAGRSKV